MKMHSVLSASGLAPFFFCNKCLECLFYNPGIKSKDYLYYMIYKYNVKKISTVP